MQKDQPFQEDAYYWQRVQTGVRIEKRLLKVLKALAESKDVSLGGLLEGIVLYAFEGQCAFGPGDLRKIEALRKVYDIDSDAVGRGRRSPRPDDESGR